VTDSVTFRLNGDEVEVPSDISLLDALRDVLGHREVKDGCAPQGQCGACTVLVNGAPRVSCVTAVSRVRGAEITTVEGLDEEFRDRLIDAMETTGAIQCGFCTPGIICRLAGTSERRGVSAASVTRALSAHLCRCTGSQPVLEAALLAADESAPLSPRDPQLAAQRATLENAGVEQIAGRDVARGRAPFAGDNPSSATVLWTNGELPLATGTSASEIRRRAGAVQGRNSTLPLTWPVELPAGEWARTLQTTFVEPAAVEPDAALAHLDGTVTAAAGNAGAFGAKATSRVMSDAREAASTLGEPVLAVWSREAVVRLGKKRPPLAIGLRADGSGVVRVGVTAHSDDFRNLVDLVRGLLPDIEVELVDVLGPPVGATHRGAILSEVLALRASMGESDVVSVTSPSGARADVELRDGEICVTVSAGEPLCPVTLRSYVIGAAHAAYSFATSEGLAINDRGEVQDLTIRSFGILTLSAMPTISVTIKDDERPAMAASGAVFAATLGAVLRATGTTRVPHALT